mmetsp:Transcript_37771/g.94780  ORF Transcript_37771/g.94780 Transcript_37771/m.94780 type:complete len:111 (-) Transcript_37771:2225-2557(-)
MPRGQPEPRPSCRFASTGSTSTTRTTAANEQHNWHNLSDKVHHDDKRDDNYHIGVKNHNVEHIKNGNHDILNNSHTIKYDIDNADSKPHENCHGNNDNLYHHRGGKVGLS